MNVDAVGFLAASALPLAPGFAPDGAALGQPGAAPAAGFESWMRAELGRVNDQVVQADALVQKLALGEADNLHQVMVALDEARVGFQLMVQVRNRVIESYQDLLRMQV